MKYDIGSSGLIVIVDLKEEISYLNSYKSAYDFYKFIPVQELISTILCVPAYDNDHYEIIWNLLDERSNGKLDNINLELIELFLEIIVQMLDDKLKKLFPNSVDYSEYIMDNWLDSTSIILKRYGYYSMSDLYPV